MATVLTSRPDIMAILEDRGYRSTAPRRAIVKVVEDMQEGFTAEDVIGELPKVGRATVFRALKLFLEVGIICRLSLLDGTPRYMLSRIEHHHHTICIKCGKIGEFRAATVERLIRAIGADLSGEIVGHRIELDVVCQTCLSAGRYERNGTAVSARQHNPLEIGCSDGDAPV